MQIGIHHRGDAPLNATPSVVCNSKETGIFTAIEIREGDTTCCTLYTHDPATLRQIAKVCEAQADALDAELTKVCSSVQD